MGGFKTPNPIYDYVMTELRRRFMELKPTELISGFAIGADQMSVEIAIELGVDFTAAIPFVGQEKMWPRQAQDKYRDLLGKAKRVEIISEGGYTAYKMQVRNEWVVNNSDLMLAVFDGTNGGTANCVRYARSKNKPIIVIDPTKAQTQ